MLLNGRAARCAAAIVALGALASVAEAQSALSSFNGTWSGGGQVRLTGGQTEQIKCRAFYTQKSSEAVNLALRCSSTSQKIEMRASLVASGSSVSGTWEERTFNASGTVAGKASPNRMNLAITGGGLSGSMSVTTSGGSQSIRISTQGTGFTGLTMRLSKG